MNNEVCVGYLTNIRDMFVVGSERCEGEALEYQNNFISALNYAIGLISDTERPKGEWTPVSKHLPDKYDSYLVMWRPLTEGYPDRLFYEICEYEPELDEWERIEQAGEAGAEIIAWMPLPKPYKEGGAE